MGEVDELVRLPAQLVRNHWRMGIQGRDHADPLAAALQRRGQTTESAIAREQDDMLHGIVELHGLHRQLDVHAASDPSSPGRVRALLQQLSYDGEPIVFQPVEKRADRSLCVLR